VLDELQQLQQQPADEAEAATDRWDERLHKPQLPMGMVQSCSSWQLAQQRNRQRTQRYVANSQHVLYAEVAAAASDAAVSKCSKRL
jgi:hypothetical protein